MVVCLDTVRAQRRTYARQVARGFSPLRVIGSRADGWFVAAQDGSKLVPLCDRQTTMAQAIALGETKYGKKAKRLMLKAA